MPDLESEIAVELRRRAESLPIDDQARDRLVRRALVHRRRRRAVLAGTPIALAAAALITVLTVSSASHPSRPRTSAAPAMHSRKSAAASPEQAPRTSTSSRSPGLALGGGGDLRWVEFVSPARGWALAKVQGSLRVAHTSDGGVSWAVVGAPLPVGAGSPAPNRLVVALGGNGLGANVAALYVYTATNPLGDGGDPRLYLSLDRGSSWRTVDFRGPVLGVAPAVGSTSSSPGLSVSNGQLWALIGSGSGGDRQVPPSLAVSTDGGSTWARTAPISVPGHPEQLVRVSQGSGFVVSASTGGSRNSSSLLETTDGGTSWRRLADPCGNLADQRLSAVDANHLWLTCGSEPGAGLQAKAVYFSTDGARTWRPTASVGLAKATSVGSLPGSGYIVGLAATSDRHVWLVLGDGSVEVSTDQGHTWRPAFSLPPATGGAEEVTFVDQSHGWALTTRGLWRTTDGLRWKSLNR